MRLLTIALLAVTSLVAVAQESQSSAVMRRGDRARKEAAANGTPQVTERMQQFMQTQEPSDADLQWMRVIYRQLDLTKPANAPLYYPDEPIDGQESLFRIIMRLLANDQIAAYEYLDGREVFTDEYRLKVRDMLDRFHILYSDAKGSNEKHPKFAIEDADVPANEVLNYYIVERWEFDKRSNRMKTRIEAICPVLSRSGDFGGEAVKYPMFWIKMDDLRPWLSTQNIFTDDDNNLATCTYADYFALGLYDGEIYKTRNLRNQSLMQMYQDPESLKRAQDSIQNRLVTYEDKLWVPTLEELQKKREAEELAAAKAEAEANGEDPENAEEVKAVKETKKATARSKRGSSSSKAKPAKTKKPKSSSVQSSSSNSNAAKSVRRRKR
ncbi:MAG: gliding motility protein GldN [Muribaculaceae bacterium]|nr:gliding motility protein GldN [Muribaculaceae bacterium]